MPAKPETVAQAKVLDELRKLYADVIRFEPDKMRGSSTGIPDSLVFINGLRFYIEFKLVRKDRKKFSSQLAYDKLRPSQKKTCKLLVANGETVYVVEALRHEVAKDTFSYKVQCVNDSSLQAELPGPVSTVAEILIHAGKPIHMQQCG